MLMSHDLHFYSYKWLTREEIYHKVPPCTRTRHDQRVIYEPFHQDKVISSASIPWSGFANQMWEAMATTITCVAREALGVTTGKTTGNKEFWWWNEDVQHKVKVKQASFRELLRSTDEEEQARLRECYKNAKKEAKKAVTEAKNAAYKRMYERLETKEGEHVMFKIAKDRERRRYDLGAVKFIKGEDGRVLIKEQEIKLRWQTYFQNLFNGERVEQQDTENGMQQRKKSHMH